MNCLYRSISSNEEGRRPAVKIRDAGKLFVELVRGPSQQYLIRDAVTVNDSLQSRRIFQLRFYLKAYLDDFQALTTKPLIDCFKKRSFVLAVWAPASTNRDDDSLSTEFRVGIGNPLAIQIRKGECQRLYSILQQSMLERIICCLLLPYYPGLRPMGRQRQQSSPMSECHKLQRVVWLWEQLGVRRSGSSKVAHNEFSFMPLSIQVASIAINAFNHSYDTCSCLTNAEFPGVFSFRTLNSHAPISRNVWSTRGGRRALTV